MGNKQSSRDKKEKKNKKNLANHDHEILAVDEVTDCDDISDIKGYKPDPCYADYVFPFENLVFEGGGNKGLGFCGAVRVLEENNLWGQIRRLAGASSGAMAAALLAVGYSSHDLENFLSQDLRKILLDHSCGYCSFLPNLFKKYGWNPGRKILDWFGAKLEQATGNRDITFLEVYQKFDRELCIVVTNVNQMSMEYCHPKTTPNMPIRIAVRMSMAIPGLFQPVCYEQFNQKDYYVDGGLLCNYPIHCYDGWWLSMKPEDSFIRRLQPLSDLARMHDKQARFGTCNDKTLGFLLFSDDEQEVLRVNLEDRDGKQVPDELPKTKLARKRLAKIADSKTSARQHDAVAMAAQKLLQAIEAYREERVHRGALKRASLDSKSVISVEELDKAVSKSDFFTQEDFQVLFGERTSVKEAFQQMCKTKNDQVTYQDIEFFLEQKGIRLKNNFLGCRRKEVTNLYQFVTATQEALLFHATRNQIQDADVERTVGINTCYVGTADFDIVEGDRKLMVEQGMRATKAYLDFYIRHKRPPLKTDSGRRSFGREDIKYFVDDDALTEIIDERDYMEDFRRII